MWVSDVDRAPAARVRPRPSQPSSRRLGRYRSPVPVTAGRTGAVSDPVPLTGVAPVDRYTADAARAGRTGAGAPVPVTTGTAVQRHAPPGTGTAVTGTARPHTRNPDGRTGPPDDPHHLPRPRSRHEP